MSGIRSIHQGISPYYDMALTDAQQQQGRENLGIPLLPTVFEIESYGAVQYDTGAPTDCTAAAKLWVAAAKAASLTGAPVTLRASGKYMLRNDPLGDQDFGDRSSVLFDGLSNVVFDCAGATWVFDGQDATDQYADTFRFVDCSGIKGNVGTFQWVTLPYTQGTVSDIGADYADFTVDSDHSTSLTNIRRIEEYTRDRVNLAHIGYYGGGTDDDGWTSSSPSAGVFRVSFAGSSAGTDYLATMAEGEIYVLTTRNYGGDALSFRGCTDVNIVATVNDAAGMAYRLSDCTNVKVVANVVPRDNNLISTTSDGVHLFGCRGIVDLAGVISGTGDDPMIVTGDSYVVVSKDSTTQLTLSFTFPYVGPRVGDALTGINDAGAATSLGLVTSFNAGTGVTVVDTTLPVGIDSTWQVVNSSAQPDITNLDIVASKCRGHLRCDAPRASGRLIGHQIVGGIAVEYIPSYFGNGYVSGDSILDLRAIDCTSTLQQQAAIRVMAYQLDGGGVADAGTMSRQFIDVFVDGTIGCGLFLGGLSNSVIRSAYFARTRLDTSGTTFAWDDYDIAIVNCDDIFLPIIGRAGSTAGKVYESNSTKIRYGVLSNFDAKNTPSGIFIQDSDTIAYSSGSAQFPSPVFNVAPTLHVTSEQCSIRIGNLMIGQDSAGNGTRDAFIYHYSTGATILRVLQDGTLILPSMPTSAPSTTGSLWRDASASNVVKAVP